MKGYEMEERRLNLIEYLTNEYKKNPERWIAQVEIVLEVDGYFWNINELSHDMCPQINSDVININNNMDVDCIIVQKNCMFKIANEKEANEYMQKLFKIASKKFKRAWNISRKIDRTGQGKMADNEIEFINTFLKNEVLSDEESY